MSAATSGDQMYSLQNVPNRAAKVVFARGDMSMLDHCLRHFTGCQSKTGLLLGIAAFVFRFCLFVFLMVSCHHTCHRFSRYTLLLAKSIPVQMKTSFLVQDVNLRALVTGRSLFRLPLSRTTFLLTHPTLHFSLTVQNVS